MTIEMFAAIRPLLLAITLVGVFGTQSVHAQSPTDHASNIPQALHYIFALPWCKAWDFNCNRCEKRGDAIVCQPRKLPKCQKRGDMLFCSQETAPATHDCKESWKLVDCAEMIVPDDCQAWSDGCNVCAPPKGSDPGGCTADACRPYVPRFTCRQWRPGSQHSNQ